MNKITMTQLKKLRLDQLEALIDSRKVTEITKYGRALAFLVPIDIYRRAYEEDM